MDAFIIRGGRRLRGEMTVNGAKNAALPQMAAALLTDQPVSLHDAPPLQDLRNMARLLRELGCEVDFDEAKRTLRLQSVDAAPDTARYDVVRTMRASICVLGPLLARRGRARVSMPGGCQIGDRPVDLHLRGLEALGASIELDQGYIVATADRLRGARVFLGGQNGSTVLGTINVMSAAVLAEGRTVIESAACEPEVVDAARLLTKMGARIDGAGSPRLVIDGVDQLHGAEHQLLPDRIEAGTYLTAAAITNGEITLHNCPLEGLGAVIDRLHDVHVDVDLLDEPGDADASAAETSQAAHGDDELRRSVRVGSARRLNPTQITTQPYPGFPTDLQAQMMALLCLADGNSIITEKIFPDRFLHVAELLRMGGSLMRNGASVLVTGVRELKGAPVMASDLRASAGLVLAGLAARGETIVNRVYHLDRGYDRMERTLQTLGAEIERVDRPAT